MSQNRNPQQKRRKLTGAIMLSGRGSNMRALVEASKNQPDFPVEFTHVLSDKPNAPGLTWAREQGLETGLVDPKDVQGILAVLGQANAALVCLAGYMRIVPSAVTQHWAGRMLNIHPSLLPAHKGLNAQQQALCAGDDCTGATVHLVTERLDDGEFLEQASVPVLPDDTVDSLSARILTVEHQIYPLAVAKLAKRLMEEEDRG